MNKIITAIILGIIEGFTEFLPISSTGHLIIANQWFNLEGSFGNMFNVVIQLGAILSVVIYFHDKLIPFSGNKTIRQRRDIWRLWKKTAVGVIPALVLGALFADLIEEYLFNPYTVAIALVVGGIILIWMESRRKSYRINYLEELRYGTVFLIGIFQCLAMVPGTSRSAATIIGAMALGASRNVAAEFSFFLAIPTMAAASGYSLLKSATMMTGEQWMLLAVGFIVSFFVALVVISMFMGYIRRKDFKPFGYYRIILGILILVLLR
ncbi:undecaprenyl-diphosphate phosphatase [Geosporobacter ferrireducens]|uniref:Undecaprenyl-diphosphatase n=1 Tax=Geosporobacter ferrireducens TaxID=1424294 RepID=A0A1D8GIS1_9FIRM|nr:undecaprenyl-diphosphate phosphatase [Geosporobacter ferrireducens]AOT70807.1 undecaprenyl-diphosphatase [Geosporobacter ferrireducens]MTI53504.1 undecaprenyl-diphosphate phosphatase [Geosporobacter ferrireducens]